MKNLGDQIKRAMAWAAAIVATFVWLGGLLFLANIIDIEVIFMVLGALLFLAWLAAPLLIWSSVSARRRSTPGSTARAEAPARMMLSLPKINGEKTQIKVLG